MKKNEFRTPLLQSGAILLAIILIISVVPSSDSVSVGSMVGGFFSNIFSAILFLIALALALVVSIAVLFAIFIAAISLQSPDSASEIYSSLKMRMAALIGETIGTSSSNAITTNAPDISVEEYDQMKTELSSLQAKNLKLHESITDISSKNAKMQDDLHTLNTMVDELKDSEAKIKSLLSDLSAKVDQDTNSELKEQIGQLESLYTSTNENITTLSSRLEALEQSATNAASVGTSDSGIFSYIERADQQTQFTETIQKAVAQEMTYAQIDEFLTENLSAELDGIIKDHPSLTKDYIRSQRK